jgi:2-phosphoglycerate kinase
VSCMWHGHVTRSKSRDPCTAPPQVYIKKEQKHAERMTVRAKYMTMHPSCNKYVRNLLSIRIIQEYLLQAADKRCMPRVANSNVDVSVGVIHTTVLRALHRCVPPFSRLVSPYSQCASLASFMLLCASIGM